MVVKLNVQQKPTQSVNKTLLLYRQRTVGGKLEISLDNSVTEQLNYMQLHDVSYVSIQHYQHTVLVHNCSTTTTTTTTIFSFCSGG